MHLQVGYLFILLLFQLAASGKKEKMENFLDELIDREKSVLFESFQGGNRDWVLEEAIVNYTKPEKSDPIPVKVVGKSVTAALVLIFVGLSLFFIVWLRMRNTMDFDLPNDIIYDRTLPNNYDQITQYMMMIHDGKGDQMLDSSSKVSDNTPNGKVFREFTTGIDQYETPIKLFKWDFVETEKVVDEKTKMGRIKPLVDKHRKRIEDEQIKIGQAEKDEDKGKKLKKEEINAEIRRSAWEEYDKTYQQNRRKDLKKILRGTIPRYKLAREKQQ